MRIKWSLSPQQILIYLNIYASETNIEYYLGTMKNFYLPVNALKYIIKIATVNSLQLCPTMCDPIPGILQARTLEWVAISFSNA